MKKTFLVDWLLLAAFVMTAITGVFYHISGNPVGYVHAVWVRWAVTHISTSLMMMVLCYFHVKMHWAWYKSLRRGMGKKSRMTLLITVAFIAMLVTGIALLGIDGANTSVGLWHYRIGIAFTVLSIFHIAKRFRVLSKSIKPHKNHRQDFILSKNMSVAIG